jgi:hypothetical protein
MAANWVSEWVRLSDTRYDICMDILHTGSPTGTWSVWGRNLGPGDDLELVGLDNPDGTSYAGELPSTNPDTLTEAALEALELEDIKSTVINISGFGGGECQLRYAATSGTGEAQVWCRVAG